MAAAAAAAASHNNHPAESKHAAASLKDFLHEHASTQLRYSIAGVSSYTGTYEPHNVLYDRPLDIKSRWTAAYVPNAPDASQQTSSTAAGTSTGTGNDTPQASVSSQPNAGGTPQLNRDLGSNGNFLSSYASAVPTSGARPRSPLPAARRTAGVQPGATPAGATQYLILKLDRPSILRKIYFGKFHRAHACNLKDLIVYASPVAREASSRAWIPILRCGLKNDNQMETFKTHYATADGVPFPVRYLKIVPLATHQPNYNYSIWFVALEGISDPSLLRRVATEYQEHRESMALRLMLKHLRSRAYHSAFQVLLQSSQLDAPLDYNSSKPSASGTRRPFEHPIVTRLFHALMQGQWDLAESCLEQAARGEEPPAPSSPNLADSAEALGVHHLPEPSASMTTAASLLSSYVERSVPNPAWTPIVATDDEGEMPCGRAGHQMELDAEKGIIWLFGGWDGSRDLGGLWAYYLREGRWRCVSPDTRLQGGPGPRSCHAMVFDPRTSFLYVMGRFVDTDKPASQNRSSSPPSGTPSTREQQGMTGASGRGLLVPRFPGASTTPESGGTPPTRQAEAQDELFVSGRGGSMRLAQGTRSSGEAPRDTSSTATQTTPLHEASSSPRRTPSSPRVGSTSSSRHPWRYAQPGFESDFFRFSTRSERWDRLSFDTSAEGGPKLLGDTQMVIDSETQLLYVFGGHEYTNEVTLPALSGMWKYDVIQRSWTFLFDDSSDPERRIPARAGHIMLLEAPRQGNLAGKRVIWIMAGKRGSNYLADMWTYHPNTGAVRQICADYHLLGGPEGGFTQRATIDSDAREITLFSGLVHSKDRSDTEAKSAFWTYHIDRNEWRLVYEAGGAGSAHRKGESGSEDGGRASSPTDDGDDSEMLVEPGEPSAFPVLQGSSPSAGEGVRSDASRKTIALGATDVEPRPRYATQMVHDHNSKLYYIFGGNPAGMGPLTRLGDLWSLELVRPSQQEVLRKIKFRLRQQRFLELAKDSDAMEALIYLQTRVSETVNHEVAEESIAFRKLMAHLLHGKSSTGADAAHSSVLAESQARITDPHEASIDSPTMLPSGAPFSPPVGAAAGAAAEEKSTHTHGGSSGSEGDSDMMAASQVLSPLAHAAHSAQSGSTSDGNADAMALEGRPSPLYNQRYRLFRSLCEFLPSEDTEPESDLLDCIDASKMSFSSILPL